MIAPARASRRWLARAGLAAAAASVSVGVAGCGGSSSVDTPPAVTPVVLPSATAPAAAPAWSAPAAAAASPPTAAPPDTATSPAPVGRNPFLPLEPPAPAAAADGVLTRLLSAGDRGEDVRRVQQALADRHWGLTVDGVFGRGTTAAVAGFQTEHGLAVDGIVGPLTWAALHAQGAG